MNLQAKLAELEGQYGLNVSDMSNIETQINKLREKYQSIVNETLKIEGSITTVKELINQQPEETPNLSIKK
jgi:hypothetical protein